MEGHFLNKEIDLGILVENMLHGYALHKIVTNDNNEPIDYVFIDINERYEQFTGLKASDIIGKKVTEILPDSEKELVSWIQHLGNIALNNKKSRFEKYYEGLNRWFSVSAFSPKKDYFVTLINDITENKRAEEELNQAADIVKNIQVGLYVYHLENIDDDRSLRMVSANPITELYTGVAPKDVIGKTIDENFPGLRAKNFPQQYANVVKTQTPIELEDVYYGDNRVIQGAFSVKAFPLPNNHVGVSFENITEKKKSKEKLVENQKFIERILNTSASIIYIYDLIKHINVFSNQNVFENLGYTKEEVKGMGSELFTMLLHPRDAKLVAEHHQKLAEDEEGRIFELTYRMKSKQGNWVWLLSRDTVFQRNKKGYATQIMGTATDITKQKKNEAEIISHKENLEELVDQRTEELKLLNAQKDKFFSIVAHDLKGPIGSFEKLMEFLHTKRKSVDEERIGRIIEQLYKTSKTTNNLLNNLLIWSRSQLNRIEIAPEKINIQKLTEETVDLMAEKASSKDIEMINKIAPDTFAFADKNSILTVLRNLVSNGINHTYRSGTVEIKSQVIKNNLLMVEVKDNGTGMPKETLDKLFKIDEEVSNLGTENEKGTGLGLLICKDFVEKNGGTIWAESIEGKGSSFYFTIPVAK